jgi:hypothetical protein
LTFIIAFAANAQVSSSEKAAQAERDKQRQEAINQQKVQEQAQANNPNAPEIEFDKLVHDYGDLEQHGDGKCEFKFTNKGKEPLILSNVRSSCGCTVPEWPRQPILPGQSETIKVKYDTKRVGTINKTIHVYSNAKTSPVTLRIKGTVHAAAASNLPEKKVDRETAPINK